MMTQARASVAASDSREVPPAYRPRGESAATGVYLQAAGGRRRRRRAPRRARREACCTPRQLLRACACVHALGLASEGLNFGGPQGPPPYSLAALGGVAALQPNYLSGGRGGPSFERPFPVVRLRGLPFNAGTEDVYDFFQARSTLPLLPGSAYGLAPGAPDVSAAQPRMCESCCLAGPALLRHPLVGRLDPVARAPVDHSQPPASAGRAPPPVCCPPAGRLTSSAGTAPSGRLARAPRRSRHRRGVCAVRHGYAGATAPAATPFPLC